MKLLVVAITLLISLTAFADNWSIVNLDTGNSEPRILTFGDQNWGRIVMGDNCIAGDLKSAYAELSIKNANKFIVEKTGITDNGITVDVTGEYCTQTYGNHEDTYCTKWEVQTHEQLLQACKADQKFFPVGRQKGTISYQVDFYTREFSLIDQFYGGTLEIERYRRSAYLNINFYKGAYSLDENKNGDGVEDRKASIRLALDPNVILNLKNGDSVDLKIARQDIDYGAINKNAISPKCTARLTPNFVILMCDGSFVSTAISLPFWALGLDGESVLPQDKFAELKIANIRTGKRLTAGGDYKSLSQLWLKIKQGAVSKACVYRGDDKNIQLDLGKEAQVLLLCGKACNQSLGAYEEIRSADVSKKGITFVIDKDVCVKESNGAQDSYECLKWKKVKESFLIPVCK